MYQERKTATICKTPNIGKDFKLNRLVPNSVERVALGLAKRLEIELNSFTLWGHKDEPTKGTMATPKFPMYVSINETDWAFRIFPHDVEKTITGRKIKIQMIRTNNDEASKVLSPMNNLLTPKDEKRLDEVFKNEIRVRRNLLALVPTKTLREAWGRADFGADDPRKLVLKTILEASCDIGSSNTISCICRDVGLLTKTFKPTKLGKEYLFTAMERNL